MVDTILVPLDGTDFAEHALAHAVALAREADAEVALVTVEVPPPMAFPDVNFLEPLSEAELRYLHRVGERVRAAGVDVSTKVLTGNVPEALERYRQDVGAGLTVMSTHGRGPLARAWLGSVADHFVRSTTAPVLMVRPTEGAEPAPLDVTPTIGHVAITLDGSELSESAVGPGVDVADLFGAELTLVRVVEYPHGTESVYIPDATEARREQLEQSREAAHAELSRVAGDLAAEGREVRRESRVVHHAASGILEMADELDVDLLVMATRGRGRLGRLVLGSVVDKVLRGTDRPVLIVPARA
ncbi:MAG: universal stress protein [Longimicrobiales bacterium]|nr:universal stress protein [Longimicrobiales bacterium]